MKKKHKIFLIELIIILFFLFFLLKIPSFIEEDFNEEIYKVSQNNEDSGIEIESTKFQVITKSILEIMKTQKNQDSYLNHILYLIEENKLNNRQNTIGQEIITFYLKKQYNESKDLSYYFLQNRLDEYDIREDQKWRNYRLYLEHNDTKFILYENINLLVERNQSKALGSYNVTIKPYVFERYIIKKKNNEIIEVFVDLFEESDREEKLSEYIDLETNLPIDKNEIIHIDFIESEIDYRVTLYIWK